MQYHKVDLIFLDIQMPRLSGLQLAGIMQQKPIIVFLTAYQDYAIDAFNIGAVDYLLKPVSFERFLQASIKALDLYKMRIQHNNSTGKNGDVDIVPDTARQSVHTISQSFIYVYVEYSLVKIDTRAILYIEGLKDYVKIFLADSTKPVITRISMKLLEERLLPFGFLRTHRSYIVSLSSIKSVQRSLISVGEQMLPVGENYREVLMQIIRQNNILNLLQ